ncbi:conserved domain protein [Paraprevotella xylaniphila YIT 11841]|uniref:Conserved domain protein n=1 Tax=Paraprevotella xylaniphila YIT 11841 TaxID=762982 RepID=F3QSW8_9BACT|nr:conserved domain protein [Paraprevotella xylaniphila YIT 11841]
MSGKSHFRLSRSIAAYARHALLTFYLRTKTLPYRQKVIPPTYEIRLFPDTPCNGHK